MTRLSRIAAVLIAVAIAYLSLEPPSGVDSLLHIDKLKHLVAYGALSGALALGWPRLALGWVIAGAATYGLAMEAAQALSGIGRTASALDALANLAGAWLGGISARWLRAKKLIP
ncbi:MAG: hypothetical protein WBG08_10030 [Litorimonas sp.]